MKNRFLVLGLLITLVLSLALQTGAMADTVTTEHLINDVKSVSLNRYSGNLTVHLKNNQQQVYNTEGTAAISDQFDIIYSYGSTPFFKPDTQQTVNGMGLLDGDGSTLIPAQYGDIEIISDRWYAGIALETATSQSYDYSSGKNFYLIDHVDVYYRGELKGTLSRSEWKNAEAFGDYLRIDDREKNVTFYTKDMQKTDRVEKVVKKKLENSEKREYYDDYDTGVWHQGSGQKAFVPSCALTADEVVISLRYQDGAVIDLQGNVVCRPIDCEPTYFSYCKGNLIRVRNSARLEGYIDRSGQQVVPCLYEEIESDLEGAEAIGYAYAVRDGKAGFVNIKTGEETGFEYSSKLCKQYAGFFTITDLDGQLIVYSAAAGRLPDKFAEIDTPYSYTHASNPLAVVKTSEGKLGVLNMQGEWVIPLSAGFEGRDRIDTSFDGTVILTYRSDERQYATYTVQYAAQNTLAIEIPSFADVFVPAEPIPETTQAPLPSADDGAWTCVNGHEGNTGKFCSECGAPMPTPEPVITPAPVQNETWTCANGHTGNTGKFCSECGAPKPVTAPDTWTCANGHSGNTGKFCSECGAPRSPEPVLTEAPAAVPAEVPAAEAVIYENPFPQAILQITFPFKGSYYDHVVAAKEFLSHSAPGDEIYMEMQASGAATEKLAWDRYSGNGGDMYIIYQNHGTDVYAYAYTRDLSVSQRGEWAGGALMPNPSVAVGSVLWVESGEDNGVYSTLLDKGANETDYTTVKSLLRNPDQNIAAQWFSHRLSIFRESVDSQNDRYWVVFHNTPN